MVGVGFNGGLTKEDLGHVDGFMSVVQEEIHSRFFLLRFLETDLGHFFIVLVLSINFTLQGF